MRKGGDGITNAARASLKQLELGVQMPSIDDMYNMSQFNYDFYQERAAQAIQQYRGHTERDLGDLKLLREQVALQASLIWEQQMQICDMNKAYLDVSDEKDRIILAENRIVHEGMEHINKMMKSMQDSLQQRHETIVENNRPIDSPLIEKAVSKLKTALVELQFANAQLVIRNEKLNRQLSFMPQEMWNVVQEATRSSSVRYEQQWDEPHYLRLSGGEYVFTPHEPDANIIVDRMRRCTKITAVEDVAFEAAEVYKYLRSRNGFVDPPINDNNYTVDDTTDMHGIIPSATAIDTPNVAATPVRPPRLIQSILTHDVAPKRTHNSVPSGQNVPPNKVPKPNPQASLNMSNSSASTPGYVANSYDEDMTMDDSNPFAPLPKQKPAYNLWRENNSSSDSTSQRNSRWNSSLQVRNYGKGKGRGKGKSFKKGKIDPNAPFWKVPDFGTATGAASIRLFIVEDFVQPGNRFQKRVPLQQQRSNLPGYVVHLPDPTLVNTRKSKDQQYDQNLQKVYHNALCDIYKMADSPRLYLLQNEEGNPVNLKGQPFLYLNGQAVYEIASEDQKKILGDYWRVLRVRPATNKFSAEKPHLEYIPNDTYGYNEVKMTLDNVKNVKVKPTRYWNELLVKDVPSDVLYSLSDYHPGLPYEANIIRDNASLGLPIFRIYETIYDQDPGPQTADGVPEEDKPRKRVDVQRTIESLLGLGTIPDEEQSTLENYMILLEEMLQKYEGYLREWPFLVAQRLLKMQVARLKSIKLALTEKLDNHPLSAANTPAFGSRQNQGNQPTSAPADTTSQSGGTMTNNSQSANRSGPMDGPSGGGI